MKEIKMIKEYFQSRDILVTGNWIVGRSKHGLGQFFAINCETGRCQMADNADSLHAGRIKLVACRPMIRDL